MWNNMRPQFDTNAIVPSPPVQAYYRASTAKELTVQRRASAAGRMVFRSTDTLDPARDLPPAILPQDQQVPRKSPSFYSYTDDVARTAASETADARPVGMENSGLALRASQFSRQQGSGYTGAIHRQPTQFAQRDWWSSHVTEYYSDYTPNYVFPETTFFSPANRQSVLDSVRSNSGAVIPPAEISASTVPDLPQSTIPSGQLFSSPADALANVPPTAQELELDMLHRDPAVVSSYAGVRTVAYPATPSHRAEGGPSSAKPPPLGYIESLHGNGGVSASPYVAPQTFYNKRVRRRRLQDRDVEGHDVTVTSSSARRLSYHSSASGTSAHSHTPASPTMTPPTTATPMTAASASGFTSATASSTTGSTTTSYNSGTTPTMSNQGSGVGGTTQMSTTMSGTTATMNSGSGRVVPLYVEQYNPVYPEQYFASLEPAPAPLLEADFEVCGSHLDFASEVGQVDIAGVTDPETTHTCALGKTELRPVKPGLDLSMEFR
ncbi:unnamed protein product [Amoebophrya sp. A25]|nr:unnamed protein product [Amoebophrya sp. A25]|eukprot:GSA25T00011444001.1